MSIKSLALGSALAVTIGASAAQAADVAPLPRDWSGFYAGIHVGLASGIDSTLRATSQSQDALIPNGVGALFVPNPICYKIQNGVAIPHPAHENDEAKCPDDGEGGNPWIWGRPSENPDKPYPPPPPTETRDYSDRDSSDGDLNFLAGINAGYNWQHGAMVLGVEADISALSDGEENLDVSSMAEEEVMRVRGPVSRIASLSTSAEGEFGLSHFGTLRARLGYDVDGTWLPFITGGLAWGKISTKGSVTYDVDVYDGIICTADPCIASDHNGKDSVTRGFGDDDYEVGWTLGAGINYRVAENAFIGLTYLYTDLGEHDISDSYEDEETGLIGSVDGEVDARFHSVRLSFDVMF